MRLRLLTLATVAALAVSMVPAAAVPVPVVASDNIELVAQLPDVAAISTAFSSDSPHMYVSTLRGFTTYDISNPELPVPLAELPFVYWENESMSLGERVAEDGTKTKFALIGLDIYGVSPTDSSKPTSISGEEVIVVDVTDPTNPHIRGRVNTPSSTHTVACVTKDCQYAYTSGAYDGGKFHVVDLTDLDKPVVVKELLNVAGEGHQWDRDALGNLWSTGFEGAAGYDVTDPLNPKTLASTDPKGTQAPYNDFIMHNAWHPGAENFTQTRGANGRLQSGTPETASVFDGNVLLVTEEDYDNPVCGGDAGEGTFSTWYVPYKDTQQYAADNPSYRRNGGAMTPLDNWNTEILDSGQRTVAGALCSAHYFTYHDAGFVAQGWYQQGTRILDVRDPHDIKQVGYFFTGATETWHAFWVPEYDENGVQTGRDTDLVYTNDAARGIDILRVGLPETDAEDTTPIRAPILPQWLAAGANTVASLPSEDWGYLCRLSVK